jgi:hypothetical protein
MTRMSPPPAPASPATRPSVWFLLALLIAWNSYAAFRLTEPMKAGHEAFIARQIGRSGLTHIALGLGVTKGSNVTAIRQAGDVVIHRSYSPMASWTVALPMALGVDFDLSARLPVLLSSNLFLIGLWSLVVARWGVHEADLATVFAVFSPVFLFRYGLTCIFEILALGPLMIALALFARPRRDAGRSVLIALTSMAAAMYSWICWVVIVPCLVRDWRAGHRKATLAIGTAAVVLPVALHFLLMGLASGNLWGDVWYFFYHLLERSSSHVGAEMTRVTYPQIIQILFKRLYREIGLIPLAIAAVSLIVAAARRRVTGLGWIAALLVMALPLNLARNIAYKHDFFVILFLPAVAISAGVGAWKLVTWFDRPGGRSAALSAILVLYVGVEVAPRYRSGSVSARDYEQATIARSIGEVVRVGDFVIASPEVCGLTPTAVSLMDDAQREQLPRPYFCGQMTQMVFVASDEPDIERLARSARPNQRVVLLDVGDDHLPIPASFSKVPTSVSRLVIGVRQPAIAGTPGRALR